jgi:hypothetical protein
MSVNGKSKLARALLGPVRSARPVREFFHFTETHGTPRSTWLARMSLRGHLTMTLMKLHVGEAALDGEGDDAGEARYECVPTPRSALNRTSVGPTPSVCSMCRTILADCAAKAA